MKSAVCLVFAALISIGSCVEYRLYTKSNRLNYDVVSANDPSSLSSSNFNTNDDTKYIIHGFTGSADDQWMVDMKNAFLDLTEDLNVFLVDWSEGASGPTYGQAMDNTRTVGTETSDFIKFLNTEVGHRFDQNHCIGHSLGAHCCGFTGDYTQSLPTPTGTIGRISGMDPAGPGFEDETRNNRLDDTDASFVDVMHTDGDGIVGYGIKMESGHTDFYPNGGADQPGCALVGGVCDHSRAHQYYLESILTDCKFLSYPCAVGDKCYTCGSGCNRMGFWGTKNPSGTFYLETNDDYPYCQA
ncbi:pancreatic lipase-related protein 2-like [Saccoglossus kowalevskii]|uniref:Pancreatic lipase-related protein 2-like n=1 Tax=Saccoglossus kowalevskii TaxID=10224 RepID=A0ABM0MTH2_SACKO|nr:PREDICTED: pancreatic lipase-related protein 2-like [Saccoglossus kowalevskii]